MTKGTNESIEVGATRRQRTPEERDAHIRKASERAHNQEVLFAVSRRVQAREEETLYGAPKLT